MRGVTIIIVLFAVCFVSSAFRLHPLKATSTRISYDKEKSILKISFEVFRDDFQTSLNTELKSRYDLFRFYNGEEVQKSVYEFFNKFVKIKLNDKDLVLKCDGAENSDDKNSFVFTTNIPAIKFKGKQKLEITNTLLLNYFKNQSNVVVINIPDKIQKVIQFNKDYTSEIIIF